MSSPEDQLELLEGQIQILMLAAMDMNQVVAACDALSREAESRSPLASALETAIVVTYARPFSASNRVGRLPHRYTPAAGSPSRDLHEWLLAERMRRYAHTDLDSGRLVLHSGELEKGFDGLVELSELFPLERVPEIRALASGLHDDLMRAAFAVQARIVALVQ